ncbi:MAG: hypothetical protein ACRD2E_05700 [Terriglobales bacterium]
MDPSPSGFARAGRAAAWLLSRRARAGGGGVVAGAAAAAVQGFARHVGALVRRLMLQLIGVAFAFFALGFGYHGIETWRQFERHAPVAGNGDTVVVAELGIALIFAYFAVSSFLRAGQARAARHR